MDNNKTVKSKKRINIFQETAIFLMCVPFLGIIIISIMKIIIKYGYEEGVFDFSVYMSGKNSLNKMLNFNLNFSLFLGIAILLLLILFFYS